MLQENEKLLNNFISNMKATGKSINTIKSYTGQIKEFLNFIGDKRFVDIEYSDCEDYQTFICNKGNSSSTIRNKRAAMSSFIKYVKRGYGKSIDLDNYFLIMDSLPKDRVRPLIIWGEEKFLNLIQYFEEKNVRIATVLALALYSGRRRSELTRFKVSDFTDDRIIGGGKLWVTGEIETKGRGKHNMTCFVMTEFKPYLDRWLAVRPRESEWLFPDEKDSSKHIDEEHVMGWFAERIKKVPGYSEFHWHMIRHTVVTTMLDEGVDTNIVVRFMGWADAKMLQVYDDRSRESIIDKYFSEMR